MKNHAFLALFVSTASLLSAVRCAAESDSSEAAPKPAGWLSHITFNRVESGIRLRYLDDSAHDVTQRDLHYRYTGIVTVNPDLLTCPPREMSGFR
jgi:hypothetical protein